MNNITNTRTSMFLDELAKDKSKIATVNPTVVFRNILGLSDKMNVDSVYRALQGISMTVKKQSEMQKRIVDPSFTGEVIEFDIGQDPAWCQFKVLRQPIGTLPGQTAVNFIVSVADKEAGKRWDRLVGSIQLEQSQGRRTPVFRIIPDIIEEFEIAKETSDNLVPLEPEEPEETTDDNSEETPETAPEEVAEEEQPTEESGTAVVVFPKDATIEFWPDPDNENKATLQMGETKVEMESDEFPIMHDVMTKVYKTTTNITDKMIESEGFGIFGFLNLIREKPWPEKPDPNEVIIPTGSRITITHAKNNEHKITITDIRVNEMRAECEYENTIINEGVYDVVADITRGVLADPDQLTKIIVLWEDPEEVVVEKDEIIQMVGHGDDMFQAIRDVKRGELKEASDKLVFFKHVELFEGEWKTPEEIETIKENKRKEEEEKAMNEKVVYAKDEVFTLPGVDGKWRAKCDITVAMTRENDGDITKYVEEVKPEKPQVADIDTPATVSAPDRDEQADPLPPKDEHEPEAPVGEEPPEVKSCADEHAATDYLKMLFKTSSPSIMHVLNVIAEENKDESIYKLIGTYPVETLSIWENYTFSIIRMKNGSFYRIFVSHTDKASAQRRDFSSMSWFSTRGDRDKWFMIGNVTDRDISTLNNRRRF